MFFRNINKCDCFVDWLILKRQHNNTDNYRLNMVQWSATTFYIGALMANNNNSNNNNNTNIVYLNSNFHAQSSKDRT